MYCCTTLHAVGSTHACDHRDVVAIAEALLLWRQLLDCRHRLSVADYWALQLAHQQQISLACQRDGGVEGLWMLDFVEAENLKRSER